MVSRTLVLVTAVFAATGAAQSSGFRPTDVKNENPPVKAPAPNVSPEMRGDIFMARKMYREAIECYKEGGATDAIMVNKTGIAYHQLLQLDLAKKYYEKSIRINPQYAEALNNLGTVFYAGKNYRRAVTQYKKALKQNPESASIYSNLGTAYFARKNYVEAQTNYEKALSLDPEVFERHSASGVLLQERNVQERAKFHYYQAKLYAKRGMNDRALLSLRKAIEEGLKERDKIGDAPEFADLRELPEFKEILAWQPRVL